MAGKNITGLYTASLKDIQFEVGAIYKNFAYQSLTTMAAFEQLLVDSASDGRLLGATNGAINIGIGPTYGRPAVNGLGNVPFKGGLLVDTVECYISGTMKQFSPNVFQTILPTSRFAMSGTQIISQRINLNISDEDYLDNTTWIGTTNFGYVIISILNPLGSMGGAITASNGIVGGDIPFRADGNVETFEETEFLPAEIKFIYANALDAAGAFALIDSYKVKVGG